MYFRYDFKEKLDLTLFKRQSGYYMATQREIVYDFYLNQYKVCFEISLPEDSNTFHIQVKLARLIINEGKIISSMTLVPLSDTKFSTFSIVKELFLPYQQTGNFNSNAVSNIIEKMCEFLKIVFKIDNLVIFI